MSPRFHPTAQLHKTITESGPAGISKMPAFGEQLSDRDINAIIAFIKSLWPDKIYRAWYQNEQQSLPYQNSKQ